MSIFRGAGGSGASNDSATLNEFIVIRDLVDADRVAAEAAATATAADLVATNQDTIDTAADLVATNQDTIDTAADLALTNADVVLTHADVVLTHADVVLAEADKVQTGLDRVATGNDKTATNADVVLTNADVVLTVADVVLTHADVVLTHADVVLAEADKVQTGVDRAAVAADLVLTNADVVSTNADATQTGLDRIAAANSAAAAAVTFDDFDDKYLGSKSSEPSVDNDGNALVTGALYFLVGTGMQVYDGTDWIAASSSGTSSLFAYEYIATAGQTSFSGADVNGQTLSYSVNNIHVTYGGLDIPTADYVATNGTAVVLDDGAVVGTIVRITAFKSFTVADTYTKAQTDAKVVQGEVFYENPTTVTADYTITTNKNAMSAGPITINSGVTITVPTNSTWTIV